MIDTIAVLTPLLTAIVTAVGAVWLARVNGRINTRIKQAEKQDDILRQVQESTGRIDELADAHKQIMEETNRQGAGIRVLLRSALQNDHKQLMKQAFIRSNQLRDFQEAYDIYHQEGGNGTATKWLEEIRSLPVKD